LTAIVNRLSVGPTGRQWLASREVDDGLVVGDDPALVQGGLERPSCYRPLSGLAAEGCVEDLGPPATSRLGLVHRDVGLVEQGLCRRSSSHGHGDADAGDDRFALRGTPGQLRDQPGTDVDRRQVAGDLGREDDELVAADAGDRVHRSEDPDQLLGDPSQHGVSRGMALGVVDLLEPVEVDGEDSGEPTGALRAGQGLVDAVDEEGPVRQARQGVMGGPLGDLGLGDLQVGHPLGLGVTEAGDLLVLGPLGGEVGEGEAQEMLTLHLEGGATDQDRNGGPLAVDEVDLHGGAEPEGAS